MRNIQKYFVMNTLQCLTFVQEFISHLYERNLFVLTLETYNEREILFQFFLLCLCLAFYYRSTILYCNKQFYIQYCKYFDSYYNGIVNKTVCPTYVLIKYIPSFTYLNTLPIFFSKSKYVV